MLLQLGKRIRWLVTEKEPGLSWIEIKKTVHEFSADDEECHSHIDDCRDELLLIKGNTELLLGGCENELMSNG
jgi:hypothetical protein